MKISNEHYQALRTAILAVVPVMPTAKQYMDRDPTIARIDRAKDTAKRYRWDLFWASRFDAAPLYSAGLNDDHIDTALRTIVKEITP